MRIALGTIMTQAFITQVIISFFVVFLIALILFILFTLIATITIARFVEKGNMGAAFDFSEIFNTINKIGWENYIVWYAVLFIILMVIDFIMMLINIIPIVGIIITLLIFYPYMTLLSARATWGLIYNEKNQMNYIKTLKIDYI
ncbi:hypothetical protein ALNOE001_20310 [Candidatus Methanobinarius endosymbioticus]|uniref:DUF4013 domain-containing protein n=1 Tax=Candidatus Methanobinarius endosymbioticus TaxID=2006182 RepID=A0A366M7T5_9EURY|nr:hypothetical protein ALNOE001_20310 [Candidatus Methanobinarius endosymbioticus]